MRRINTNIYKLRNMFMILISISVICTSIGYSALSSSLMISGEAYVRVEANVRITNVTWLESNNQGYESYNSEYYKEGIKVFATLPNIDSSITYKIEITNNTDIIYIIDGINELINSNELMTYTIENIDSDILNNEVSILNMTIKYKDDILEVPSNNIGVFELKFDLEIKDVTPPVLTVNEVYEDGTVIYYDVLNGTTCTNYHEDNSKTNYNGTTDKKTTDNQNSCLKFYVFNDDEGDERVNLLLDHNTTQYAVWVSGAPLVPMKNTEGPDEVIEQLKIDTNSWVGTITPANYTVSQTSGGNYTIDYSDYKARLITANEIAEITGNTSFDESTTSSSNWFYFDTKTTSSSSTCKSGDTSGCSYGWLYDRTSNNCEEYGCLNNLNIESYGYEYGYWTSTSAYDNNFDAWFVCADSQMQSITVTTSDGVRPVIEVLKSNLEEKQIVINSYDNESGLSSDNNYQYYLSTSSTTLENGTWTNYTIGKPITIKQDKTLYLWLYPVKDNVGNVNDNKEFNAPYVALELKALYKEEILNGAYPILDSKMIPIYYDNFTPKVADMYDKWYSYEEQKWANAVVLVNSPSKTYSVGDTILESDVAAYFVWIPRYEYTLKGTYGVNGTSQETPGYVDVKFTSINEKNYEGSASYNGDTPSNYRTQDAFKYGDDDLFGIWVGKFETSYETNVMIKPNQYPMCATVSYQFEKSLNLGKTYNLKYETTMLKNDEWNAIAILSQSLYGRCNSDSTCPEMSINNSNKTGNSAGSSSAVDGYTVYAYNTALGVTASTTMNITGIYDMKGGSIEAVMGVLVNSSGNLYSGYDTNYNSGYNGLLSDDTSKTDGQDFPDEKYYNSYTSGDVTTACNGNKCYGMAEFVNWYNNFYNSGYMIDSSNPWLIRGGSSYGNDYYDYYGVGIWGMHNFSGAPNDVDGRKINYAFPTSRISIRVT